MVKKPRAADECISPRISAIANGLEIYAAINANPVLEPSPAPPRAGLLNFGQRLVNELLAAKTGIDRHDEQLINLFQIWLDHGNGGWRIDGQSHFFAERFNFPNQGRNLVAQLDVNI